MSKQLFAYILILIGLIGIILPIIPGIIFFIPAYNLLNKDGAVPKWMEKLKIKDIKFIKKIIKNINKRA